MLFTHESNYSTTSDLLPVIDQEPDATDYHEDDAASNAQEQPVGMLRRGIDYLNLKAAMAYARVAEHVQGNGEHVPKFGSARVWLAGAAVLNITMARAYGSGVFEGAEDAAVAMPDSALSGGEPTVEMSYQSVSFAQPVVEEPIEAPVDVDWNIQEGSPMDWVRDRWNDLVERNDTIVMPTPSADDPAETGPTIVAPEPIPPSVDVTPQVPEPERTSEPVPVPDPPASAPPAEPLPEPASAPETPPSDPVPPVNRERALLPDVYDTDRLPQGGEYLWNHMDRIGVPPEHIMAELERAAKELEDETNNKVEWHGSGKNRWIEINGKSDTASLWTMLLPRLK